MKSLINIAFLSLRSPLGPKIKVKLEYHQPISQKGENVTFTSTSVNEHRGNKKDKFSPFLRSILGGKKNGIVTYLKLSGW